MNVVYYVVGGCDESEHDSHGNYLNMLRRLVLYFALLSRLGAFEILFRSCGVIFGMPHRGNLEVSKLAFVLRAKRERSALRDWNKRVIL